MAGTISAGILLLDAGTNSAPSIAATTSPTAGIVFPAANTMAFSTGSLERVRIDSSGYVLMGYTSSQGAYKLQVTGGAGLAGATAWTNLSDKRIKTNIEAIADGLSKVMELKPVNFDYVNPEQHPDARERGGFLAQDVLAVFPDMVTKNWTPTGNDKNLVDADGSAYALTLTNKFHAYLVAAIQEQQKIIDALANRIEMLEQSK